MSYQTSEPAEAFDWYHTDIYKQTMYSHYDMVIALNNGEFIIEGEVSTFDDALDYAHHHCEETTVWDALKDLQAGNIPEYVY